MLIQATQLRPGMVLEYNNDLWRVMTITHITPGNWRGMVQTKLRNIKSGSQTENRFRSEDRVERIILSQVMMQFLYQDGDDYHFMNTENYEQITIPRDLIEDVVGFPDAEYGSAGGISRDHAAQRHPAEDRRSQSRTNRSRNEECRRNQHPEARHDGNRLGGPGPALRQ